MCLITENVVFEILVWTESE